MPASGSTDRRCISANLSNNRAGLERQTTDRLLLTLVLHKQGATLLRVMKPVSCLFLLLALATGCATPKGPTNIAESYAKALEENRLADAYALTTGLPEGVDGFQERYKEEAARRERAASVRASMDTLEARAPALILERRSNAENLLGE